MAFPDRPVVVFDTNVILDAAFYRRGPSRQLSELVGVGLVEMLATDATIEEAQCVARVLRRRFRDMDLPIMDRMLGQATVVDLDPSQYSPAAFPFLRDPDDTIFLALLIHGGADALATRDQALLKSNLYLPAEFQGTIARPRDVLAMLTAPTSLPRR